MRTILFMLILSLASGMNLNTCPPAEDLHPCECQYFHRGFLRITCDDKSLSDKGTLKTALSGLTGKKINILDLIGFALGRVPSDFFRGLDIQKLTLTDCDLDTLSEGGPALLGLENYLEILSIWGSFNETNIPTKLQIQHLKRLQDLNLVSNSITELGDEWFEGGPTSLQILDVSDNEIEYIGINAFADLVNLRYLRLEGNRFGQVQRSVFPNPAIQLETLYLSSNALTALTEDLFTEMPALDQLSIDNNEIEFLDEGVWGPVWLQLKFLDLRGNPLHCDNQMDWLFEQKSPDKIIGTCRYPEELDNQAVLDFIKSNRQ